MVRFNDLGITNSKVNNNKLDNYRKDRTNKNNNFKDIFRNELKKSELSFSAHAKERMKSRGIDLDETQTKKLQEAVERADAKGARECLVLVDNNAFVVSVKNKKVITAVDHEHMRGNVFTNIDSAVLGY